MRGRAGRLPVARRPEVGYDRKVGAIGVIGLIVGLMIALSPRAHPAVLRDTTTCWLGRVLVAVSTVLILTSTLAAPPMAHHQMPSAPAPRGSRPALQGLVSPALIGWVPPGSRRAEPASPIMPPPKHGAAQRAEQGQDRPDYEQDHPDNPKDDAMDEERHDE